MKICGIYRILNTVNNKIYIGQSINIHRRFSEHRKDLNRNIHYNILLQQSWNKYGADAFKFEILIICNKNELKKHEKAQAEKIPQNQLFNISKNYDHLYGKNNPFYGKKHTQKTKQKLSTLAKKRIGSKNPNYGNKYSIETKIKAGHNKKTKLTKKQVLQIIKINNKTHQEIADKYGVCRTLISRIKNGKRWNLITQSFMEA